LSFIGGKDMQYKQNVHILLPVEKFEELKELGHRLNVPRSELVRKSILLLLKKYKRKLR
jgi:hypothetical protein